MSRASWQQTPRSGRGLGYEVFDGCGRKVANVLCDGDVAKALANARLIAAAPELLEALKKAHHALAHPVDEWKDEVENRALPIVSAAIVKAESSVSQQQTEEKKELHVE